MRQLRKSIALARGSSHSNRPTRYRPFRLARLEELFQPGHAHLLRLHRVTEQVQVVVLLR